MTGAGNFIYIMFLAPRVLSILLMGFGFYLFMKKNGDAFLGSALSLGGFILFAYYFVLGN